MRASGREFIQKANGMLRGGARVIPMKLMQGCPLHSLLKENYGCIIGE